MNNNVTDALHKFTIQAEEKFDNASRIKIEKLFDTSSFTETISFLMQ